MSASSVSNNYIYSKNRLFTFLPFPYTHTQHSDSLPPQNIYTVNRSADTSAEIPFHSPDPDALVSPLPFPQIEDR